MPLSEKVLKVRSAFFLQFLSGQTHHPPTLIQTLIEDLIDLMFAVSLKRLPGVAPSMGTMSRLLGSIYAKAKFTLGTSIIDTRRIPRYIRCQCLLSKCIKRQVFRSDLVTFLPGTP